MIALLAALAFQCPDGSPPPCARGAPAARAPSANSVAVLYFESVSRDSSDATLADGLTDEIILRLQQVPRLEVKSRYESQRLRGRRGAAPADLGRAVGARYLVNGSIQRAGQRLVVRVELTRADRGVGVWSERFDRTSEDVLGVIDDVARGIATGVAGRLLPVEATELARRPTTDPVAYDQYVRGNVFLARRTAADLARAIVAYEAAYARDPAFALALGRVAYAWSLGIVLGVGDLPADTTTARAEQALARARRDAPDVPETWLALGFRDLMRGVFFRDDRSAQAVTELARGVQLDPRNAEAHHQYAQGLALVGQDSAAEAEYRTALRLEPGRAVSFEELGRLRVHQGRYAEAVAWADSAVAADPQLVRGLLVRARARLGLGDVAGARRDAAAAAVLSPTGRNASEARSVRAMVMVAEGDTAGGRMVADSLTGRFTIFGTEMWVAVGRVERAFDEIESQSAGAIVCYRLGFPLVAALRGTPRFDRLAAACPRD